MDANDRDSPQDAELARKDREWAARSEASLHDAALSKHTAAGAGSAGSTRGSGQSSGPHAYTTPKNLRTSTGPRFSGRGVLAVFGILGVLLTVGIMAFLAVKVLGGVSNPNGAEGDHSPANDTPIAPVVPGVPAVPAAPGIPGGAEIDPSSPTDAARAAACDAERATIETAATTFEVLQGKPPATIDELVAAGYLTPGEDGFSHELSAGGAVVPTGDCG